MADNRYTAKIRAKRIELEYFKRLHPFRRWKLILSVVAPLVAGVWLIAYAARGDQRIYTSGPLSTGHAMFETTCADCHRAVPASSDPTKMKASNRAFFIPVSDQTCLSCHDGPVHHETQRFGPTCASCHVEHKGHVELAAIADNTCTQCHATLRTKSGTPAFAEKVSDFTSNHPEFAITVKGDKGVRRVRLDQTAELKDTAQVKLNHQKHLKVGLKGIEDIQKAKGKGVPGILDKKEGPQLACAFCHVLDESRRNMQPISFAKHCADCHPLDVDGRLPTAVAPHDKPPLVHAYLRTLFIEAFEQCQTPSQDPKLKQQCVDLELAKAEAAPAARGGRGASAPAEEAPADRPRGGRLGRGAEAAPEPPKEEPPAEPRGGRRLGRGGEAAEEPPASDRPRGRRGRGDEGEARTAAAGPSALDWAATQLQGAEKIMFKQKCEFCHMMTTVPNQPPQVAPTLIPARWLPHSVFDHGAHRPLGCVECHQAAASKETTDVLLPSVKVCRECHQDRGGARAGCVECHVYHDKTKERDPSGPFTVPQLVKRRPSSASSAGSR